MHFLFMANPFHLIYFAIGRLKRLHSYINRVDLDENIKISDFGLARDVYSSSYYRQLQDTRLPIKWMAIESLHDRVYCTETDLKTSNF